MSKSCNAARNSFRLRHGLLLTSLISLFVTALGDLFARCDPVRRDRQFDRICQWFMTHDLVYARELRHVWLWDEWLGPGSTSASVSRKTWRAAAAATLGAATARRCVGSCPPRRTGVVAITADESTAATREEALSVGAHKVPTLRRQAIRRCARALRCRRRGARRRPIRSGDRGPQRGRASVFDAALAQTAPDAAPASRLGAATKDWVFVCMRLAYRRREPRMASLTHRRRFP